jgi:hypothetical protein
LESYNSKLPRTTGLREAVFGDKEEKGVRLPAVVKRQVYENAQRRCECCGKPLKISQGAFHHLRKPSAGATPSNIQFLCGTHHRLGHERKTKVKQTRLGFQSKTIIKRKRVRKHPTSVYWKNERNRKKTRQKKKNKRTE